MEFLTAVGTPPSHLFYCVVGLGGATAAEAVPAPSPAAAEDLSPRLEAAVALPTVSAGPRTAQSEDVPVAAKAPGRGVPVVAKAKSDEPVVVSAEGAAPNAEPTVNEVVPPANQPIEVASEGADGDAKEEESLGTKRKIAETSAGEQGPGAPFEVGTIVEIEDRVLPGRNSQGGVARITAVRTSADGGIAYDVSSEGLLSVVFLLSQLDSELSFGPLSDPTRSRTSSSVGRRKASRPPTSRSTRRTIRRTRRPASRLTRRRGRPSLRSRPSRPMSPPGGPPPSRRAAVPGRATGSRPITPKPAPSKYQRRTGTSARSRASDPWIINSTTSPPMRPAV